MPIRSELFDLLQTSEPPALGPGPRNGREPLAALKKRLDLAFAKAGLAGTQRELVRAAVYLWHDHLDDSHTISQSIENADGSYLHAIMHRREPDYWNSKYWFRRVGPHACFQELARQAAETLHEAGETELLPRLLPKGKWDPCAFVDECERAAGLPAEGQRAQVLVNIQAKEFRVLLQHFAGAGNE